MQKHQRFSSRWKKSWWQKLDYERFQTSNLHHFYHMPSIKEIPTGWKLYVCCPWSARMEKRRVQSELPNVQAYGEQKVFNGRNFVSFSAGGEWRSTCKRRHLKHPDSSNQSQYWGDGLSHTVSPFWPRYLSWAARSSSFCGTTSRRRTLQFLSPQSWDWSASLRRKYSGIKLLSFQLAEMVIISILSNLTRTQDLDLGPPKQILPSANTWGTDCRLQQQGKPKGDPRVWCCLGKRQHGNTSSPSCSGLQPHPGRAGLRPHRGGAFCNRPRRRPRLLWNLEEKGS